jgi:hypothetical protein
MPDNLSASVKVAVFQRPSADIVTDLADCSDLPRLEGIAPIAVTTTAVTGGVRVSRVGSESVALAGPSLVAIPAAAIVFA